MQLIDIQKLQFSDKDSAEKMMLKFLKENEDEAIQHVQLTPKPESLNSINGFITYNDGERLFFKTHVEENEQVSEYYNASVLQQAGYPVISAKQIRHRPGKQIALYEIVTLSTLFDLLKKEEDDCLQNSRVSEKSLRLLEAQRNLEKCVANIYANTLEEISPENQARAPIHQLFFHRLADDGRLGLFYKGKSIDLDSGSISFEDLANKEWKINGVVYTDTISQIIERCRYLLNPESTNKQSGVALHKFAIVGHGDAHNGNIFVDEEASIFHMFDPAFAGKHSILLDLVKPLFHNIFARWMYYPEQVKHEFNISSKVSGNLIEIEHTYFPSALRLSHLSAKKEQLIKPTISMLKERDALCPDWLEIVRSALFCCPFLTVNLFAPYVADGTLSERYTLPIKLLGLSMAVSLGSSGHQGQNNFSDLIDETLSV